MKVIQGRWERTPWYTLNFYYHGTQGGYGFPCDQFGTVDESILEPLARENYYKCLADGSRRLRRFIQSGWTNEWIAGQAHCPCGDIAALENSENECRCGRLYDRSGQRLAAAEPDAEQTRWR